MFNTLLKGALNEFKYLVYEYLLLCRLMSSFTTGFAEVDISICSSRAEVMRGTLQAGSTSRSLSLLFRAVSQAVTVCQLKINIINYELNDTVKITVIYLPSSATQ